MAWLWLASRMAVQAALKARHHAKVVGPSSNSMNYKRTSAYHAQVAAGSPARHG